MKFGDVLQGKLFPIWS